MANNVSCKASWFPAACAWRRSSAFLRRCTGCQRCVGGEDPNVPAVLERRRPAGFRAAWAMRRPSANRDADTGMRRCGRCGDQMDRRAGTAETGRVWGGDSVFSRFRERFSRRCPPFELTAVSFLFNNFFSDL